MLGGIADERDLHREIPPDRVENCLLSQAPGADPGGAGVAGGADAGLYRTSGSAQHPQGAVTGHLV